MSVPVRKYNKIMTGKQAVATFSKTNYYLSNPLLVYIPWGSQVTQNKKIIDRYAN